MNYVIRTESSQHNNQDLTHCPAESAFDASFLHGQDYTDYTNMSILTRPSNRVNKHKPGMGSPVRRSLPVNDRGNIQKTERDEVVEARGWDIEENMGNTSHTKTNMTFRSLKVCVDNEDG